MKIERGICGACGKRTAVRDGNADDGRPQYRCLEGRCGQTWTRGHEGEPWDTLPAHKPVLTWEPWGRLSSAAMAKVVDRRQADMRQFEETREESERICTTFVTLIDGVRPTAEQLVTPHRAHGEVCCGMCGASVYNEVHYDDNGDPL